MVNRVITIGLLLVFTGARAIGQCNVEKGTLDNGNIFYAHAKEIIYKNEDLENGILMASVRLVVIQSSNDKDLLQFTMLIDVGRNQSKQMVVPRKISIQFTDNTSIDLDAESLGNPYERSSVFFERSTFRLRSANYVTLQQNSIQKIRIIDSRQNRELLCQPYNDILLEQANCIAKSLEH